MEGQIQVPDDFDQMEQNSIITLLRWSSMKFLLNTHLLLWTESATDKLSSKTRSLLSDTEYILIFNAASLWEITIKIRLERDDFKTHPHLLRHGLIENDYEELPITSHHAMAVSGLPEIHRNPFDRILIAQALVERLTLPPYDLFVQAYPRPVKTV